MLKNDIEQKLVDQAHREGWLLSGKDRGAAIHNLRIHLKKDKPIYFFVVGQILGYIAFGLTGLVIVSVLYISLSYIIYILESLLELSTKHNR